MLFMHFFYFQFNLNQNDLTSMRAHPRISIFFIANDRPRIRRIDGDRLRVKNSRS